MGQKPEDKGSSFSFLARSRVPRGAARKRGKTGRQNMPTVYCIRILILYPQVRCKIVLRACAKKDTQRVV